MVDIVLDGGKTNPLLSGDFGNQITTKNNDLNSFSTYNIELGLLNSEPDVAKLLDIPIREAVSGFRVRKPINKQIIGTHTNLDYTSDMYLDQNEVDINNEHKVIIVKKQHKSYKIPTQFDLTDFGFYETNEYRGNLNTNGRRLLNPLSSLNLGEGQKGIPTIDDNRILNKFAMKHDEYYKNAKFVPTPIPEVTSNKVIIQTTVL